MHVCMQMFEYMPDCVMSVKATLYCCPFSRWDLEGLSGTDSLKNHSLYTVYIYMHWSRKYYNLLCEYQSVFIRPPGICPFFLLPSFIELLYTHCIHQGVQHDHRCKWKRPLWVDSAAQYVLHSENIFYGKKSFTWRLHSNILCSFPATFHVIIAVRIIVHSHSEWLHIHCVLCVCVCQSERRTDRWSHLDTKLLV